jgi:hypothetical protein
MSHNLNIQSYNLTELFQLLDLPLAPTKEQMFLAKKKVLLFHPDKSHLPNEYFLFYKQAFDIALKYYEDQNRQNREITEENTTYRTKDTDPSIKEKISGQSFNPTKFNEIFENKMMEKREYQNQWFQDSAPAVSLAEQVSSSKNIDSVFEKMKEKKQSMVVHREFQNFNYTAGGKFYDNDEEDRNEYISSDPFSKLKFDDLRKVHKDQTIFDVGESDFKKVNVFDSVDHYMRERDKAPVIPLETQKAERLFQENERRMKEKHLNHLHESNLKTMRYADKNKEILSAFMQLENTK